MHLELVINHWLYNFILDIAKAVLPVLYVKFNYPDYIFIASLSVLF